VVLLGSSSVAFAARKTFLTFCFAKKPSVVPCVVNALGYVGSGFLFLFSLKMVAALAGWLIATGQVGTVEGLFLFCACSSTFCACSSTRLLSVLYLSSLIRSAVPEARTHHAQDSGAA
jgi:hypothetical protein